MYARCRALHFKRDKLGDFVFMHHSFLEYSLVPRIHIALAQGDLLSSLKTRRLDRKVVFFPPQHRVDYRGQNP